jgi:abortive infection bacteriophage resistance protein
MLTEILPFGVITNIYSNIKNKKIKKRIAQSFGLQVAPFESWLTIITVTRNSCCHHARVWNRVFSIRATMPIRMSRPWITLPTDPLKVYFDMCIIKYFLDIISPNNDMLDKMNRFDYGVRLRVGITRRFAIYGQYRISNLLKKNLYSNDLPKWEIGIQIF